MKTSTSDLRNLLHGSTAAAFANLVTVTLADATVARWTTDTYDIVYGGNTYTAGGSGTAPLVRLGRIREAVGLEVSTLEVTLGCGPASGASIGGTDLRVLAVSGRLDDARVAVVRAYMATPGGAVVGVVDRFSGLMTDCEADSNEVRARVQSDLYRLEEQLPRHLIREKCSWALGDTGCGVNLAPFTTTETIDSITTGLAAGQMAIDTTDPVQATGYYNGGTFTFTSGVNSGVARTIKIYQRLPDPPDWYGYFVFDVGIPAASSVGDGVSIVVGCDKTIAVCTGTFSNLTRRRGFDFVPPPDYVTR